MNRFLDPVGARDAASEPMQKRAASVGRGADVLVDGYTMGSLSMTAYTLGCEAIAPTAGGGAPTPPDVPPDETNM